MNGYISQILLKTLIFEPLYLLKVRRNYVFSLHNIGQTDKFGCYIEPIDVINVSLNVSLNDNHQMLKYQSLDLFML